VQPVEVDVVGAQAAQGVLELADEGLAAGPVELPVVGRIIDAPFLAVVVALRPEKIAALLLDTAVRPPAEAAPDAVAVSDASPELLDAMARLLALLDSPADATALAAGVEREVLWRLVTGPRGALVHQIGVADGRLTHVARAIHWIRHHYREPVRVEDLAALATMSVSAFHRNFRAVTSMTPIQFQKQIRLHEARTRLLAERADVASIGVAVGYDSPSQFSREYRRMYGVPPSHDRAVTRPGS
jgi:AraC-like DNA-binding protein